MSQRSRGAAPVPAASPADDRARRRRELLREIEQLRAMRARLAPGRVRRLRLERLHTLTRLRA